MKKEDSYICSEEHRDQHDTKLYQTISISNHYM